MNDHPSRGFSLSNPTVLANAAAAAPAVDSSNPAATLLATVPGPSLAPPESSADVLAETVNSQASDLPGNAPVTAPGVKPFGAVAIVVAMIVLLAFVFWRK